MTRCDIIGRKTLCMPPGIGGQHPLKRKRLFVDIDGTLAVWRNAEQFEELLECGYFRMLRPNQAVVSAVIWIMANHPEVEMFTLSAYLTESKYALDDKNGWIDEHLPNLDTAHRIFSPCGEEKSLYVPGGIRQGDVLLDDYTPNLTEWAGSGGCAVKLMNGINGTKGTWGGPRVAMNQPASTLAKEILYFCAADK